MSGQSHAAPSRWWIAALAASAAINLFLIGLIIGDRLAAGPATPEDMVAANSGPGGFSPRSLLRELSGEEREAVRVVLRDAMRDRAGGGFRSTLRERREARLAVMEALAADPFEPDVAEAALARLYEADSRLHIGGQGVFLEVWAELEPDTRTRILESWQAQRMRRPGPPPPRGH